MRWSSRIQLLIAAAVAGAAWVAGEAVLRPQSSSEQTPQATATPSPASSPQPAKRPVSEFFVMIDPSHGGDDFGAILGPSRVPEKEISLALARQLKRQLEDRGIAARLLRDADVNLSLEQRAARTNEEHAGLYVALHAGQPGKGARVYAPALSMMLSPPAGRFLAWETAQADSLEQSRLVAGIVTGELRKTGLTVAGMGSTLRPLNNVIAPAIAVEWAPGTDDLRSPRIQKAENLLVSGIATAILASRNREGKGPTL
jgi:N-acetylmuramoyl-L-alanine amidase